EFRRVLFRSRSRLKTRSHCRSWVLSLSTLPSDKISIVHIVRFDMPGGMRLSGMLGIFVCIFVVFLVANVAAGDNTSSAVTTTSGPPKARVDSAEEVLHGHKITDRYRWLEDTESPETKAFVRDQLAYTRSVLD